MKSLTVPPWVLKKGEGVKMKEEMVLIFVVIVYYCYNVEKQLYF